MPAWSSGPVAARAAPRSSTMKIRLSEKSRSRWNHVRPVTPPISERPGRSWNLSSYTGRQPALFEDSDGALALEDDELSGSAIRYLLHSVVADMGYAVRFALLDAADYGAPQHRLRFVLLGSRDGQPADFAPPTHGNALMPFATVRDAIADVQSDPGPGSAYTDVTRRYFDLVPAGGNWRSLPPEVAIDAMGERSMNAGGGKTGFFRRLSWDAPSPTVTGKPNRKGSAMCHPAESRPLSVRECARLQGFPDDWKFSGSVAQRYLQIGNAVPVALGWGIGLSLRDGESPVEPPSIDTMLDAATGRLKSAARNKKSAAR